MSNLSQVDIEKFRSILLEQRAALKRDIDGSSEKDGASSRGFDSEGELSDYPDHPADMGSEVFEHEKDLALRANARDLLEEVEGALRKMADGNYGVCASCRKPIPFSRLTAKPYAVYCVSCQSLLGG